MGDRSRESAEKLWKSLPGVCRQCAVAYTDFWESYKTVIPRKRHRAVGKETGQTNPIERLNNTFRQRISRLVRESLSFSKKMENHVGEPFGISYTTTMPNWQGIKPHHYYRITTSCSISSTFKTNCFKTSLTLAGVCSQSSALILGINRRYCSSMCLRLPDFVPPPERLQRFFRRRAIAKGRIIINFCQEVRSDRRIVARIRGNFCYFSLLSEI